MVASWMKAKNVAPPVFRIDACEALLEGLDKRGIQ
jgi:hypothetical protein